MRVLKPSLSPATQRFPLSLTPCPGVIHRLQLMNHYSDVTTVTKAHGLHEGSLLVLYPHGFDGRTVTCVIITSHTEEVHCPKSPGGSTFHPSLPLPEAPATTHLFVVSCSWVQTVCSPLDVFFLFPFPQIFTPPPSSQNTHAVPLKQKREVEKNSSLTRLTQSLNMTGHFGGGVIVHCSPSSYQEARCDSSTSKGEPGPSSHLAQLPSCFPKTKGLLLAVCLSRNYLVSVLLPSNYFSHLRSNCLLLLISTRSSTRRRGPVS